MTYRVVLEHVDLSGQSLYKGILGGRTMYSRSMKGLEVSATPWTGLGGLTR